jgi:hypothetical protein
VENGLGRGCGRYLGAEVQLQNKPGRAGWWEVTQEQSLQGVNGSS